MCAELSLDERSYPINSACVQTLSLSLYLTTNDLTKSNFHRAIYTISNCYGTHTNTEHRVEHEAPASPLHIETPGHCLAAIRLDQLEFLPPPFPLSLGKRTVVF